jgi:hypothetical protein
MIMRYNFASLASATAAVGLATFGAAAVLAQQAQQTEMDKPAGAVLSSTTRTATVTQIDKQDRWITLKLADGSLVDIHAGPAVKNFDQIKVGDVVTARQDDTVAIEVKAGSEAAPSASSGASVVTAPQGAKPMAVMVEKAQVSGKVTAIDYNNRLVTLKGPAGKSRTIEVGRDVQRFNAIKQGDDVVLTVKTATVIDVAPPTKKANPKPGY